MSGTEFSYNVKESPSVQNQNSLPSAPGPDSGAAGSSTQSGRCKTSGNGFSDSKEDIETDASTNSGARDAPGQSCSYIPPGPHYDEFYRLATFSKFPIHVPVKAGDLAAAGMYFTGFRDRVKCFSCGMSVENWVLGDDGMDRRWHKSDCAMVNGNNYMNIALPTPSFRTLLRSYMGLPTKISGGAAGGRHDNYAAAPGTGNKSSSVSSITSSSSSSPMDVTEVTSNFSRVRLNEPLPELVFANIVSMEHHELLLSINLKSEADRRSTFTKWPSYPAPYLPGELAKQGFFYLGNLDRTQCFSCSGVLRNWAPNDDVFDQHRKHFPDCRMVRKIYSGNIPMSEDEREATEEAERVRLASLLPIGAPQEPADPPPEEQRRLKEYYPCRTPVNPHMRTLQSRIESFERNWPNRIKATPNHIAKAGFYFLGESDKTKCYYCNGGLQNWDENDEPWTEHAKWFPGCEYVLQQKGFEFVRRIADQHPNLNRPYIRNPASYDIPPDVQHRSSSPRSNSNINIAGLVNMGFDKDKIERAIERKSAQGGYNTTEELIQDLLEATNDLSPANGASGSSASNPQASPTVNPPAKRGGVENNTVATKIARTASPAAAVANEGESMQRSLQSMADETTCKNCKKNKTEMMFIPCGHLCVCEKCAPTLKRCILCRTKIQNTMKIFRA